MWLLFVTDFFNNVKQTFHSNPQIFFNFVYFFLGKLIMMENFKSRSCKMFKMLILKEDFFESWKSLNTLDDYFYFYFIIKF